MKSVVHNMTAGDRSMLICFPSHVCRLFPFMTVSGALGVVFVIVILILAAQRFLLPGIIIIGSFVLFALWLTGLIETGLQLYGSQANVNSNCQNYVSNSPYKGNTVEALAWLTQNNICKFRMKSQGCCFSVRQEGVQDLVC